MFSAKQLPDEKPPAVMTIAGTDSSGGAGIQADLKTFTALGCYGTSVVTAMTAQNTTGVQAVHPSPPEFVEQQLRSVLEDTQIQAIKTGMLYDSHNIRAITKTLASHYATFARPPVVCDPVCVSTSGHTLLQPEAVTALIEDLFPLATLITPNKSEAELLLSTSGSPVTIGNLESMLKGATKLLSLGPKAVLLKGGHITVRMQDVDRVRLARSDVLVIHDALLSDNMEILSTSEADPANQELVADVLCQSDHSLTLFLRPRIDSTSTHGTGCTLSAALACALAKRQSLLEATKLATGYTHLGIETAWSMGKGCGPLNHMHSIMLRNVSLPSPSNPHPFTRFLISATSQLWKSYVEHDFVQKLGRGDLRRECFVHFIKQDYHYLKYYGRAYALLGAKSPSFAAIQSAAETMLNVTREISTHVSFCAQWNITEDELRRTPESPATTAYGAFIIDTGLQGDSAKLLMALAACLLGYGEVGLWLKKEASKSNSWAKQEGNPYLRWIEDYSGEHYQTAVKIGINAIEACAAADPPSRARLDEWVGVWEKCVRLEKGFWDMALGLL